MTGWLRQKIAEAFPGDDALLSPLACGSGSEYDWVFGMEIFADVSTGGCHPEPSWVNSQLYTYLRL